MAVRVAWRLRHFILEPQFLQYVILYELLRLLEVGPVDEIEFGDVDIQLLDEFEHVVLEVLRLLTLERLQLYSPMDWGAVQELLIIFLSFALASIVSVAHIAFFVDDSGA